MTILRGILRWGARLALVLAVALLGLDLSISMERSNIEVRSLADWWRVLSPAGLAQTETTLRGIADLLWDPLALFLLACPLWLALGLLAGLVFRLTRAPRAD